MPQCLVIAQCCLFFWRPSASLMKMWREIYCTSHFSEVWPVMTSCQCFLISRDLCLGSGKQWCWSLFDLYAWNPAFHISNFEFLQICCLGFHLIQFPVPVLCVGCGESQPKATLSWALSTTWRELALEHKTNRNRKKSSSALVFFWKNNAVTLGMVFVVLLSCCSIGKKRAGF